MGVESDLAMASPSNDRDFGKLREIAKARRETRLDEENEVRFPVEGSGHEMSRLNNRHLNFVHRFAIFLKKREV